MFIKITLKLHYMTMSTRLISREDLAKCDLLNFAPDGKQGRAGLL